MSLAEKKTYTVDDILALPEDVRAELIDGQIYYQATPSDSHQAILSALYLKIGNYINAKGGECKVRFTPYAVFLTENNKNYLEPDLTVICDESKLTEEGCKGTPDFIIEIVSPSTRNMDYGKKMLKYATAGVREYWIVDREKDIITVYDFITQEYNSYTFSDTVKVGIFDDLEINFSELN